MTAPDDAGSVHLPIYPLQFVDAYLFDAAVRRVPNVAGASDEPALHLSAVSAHVQEEDRVLVATIGASVAVPYGSGNRLEIACQTSGHFRSEGSIEAATADSFLPTAFVLIYPYLRAHIGELARMTALAVPPLPTIDAEAARELVQGLVDRARGDARGAPKAPAGRKRRQSDHKDDQGSLRSTRGPSRTTP
jgi:preprotein translocase subunit SecB